MQPGAAFPGGAFAFGVIMGQDDESEAEITEIGIRGPVVRHPLSGSSGREF